jgi:hypothetical protein
MHNAVTCSFPGHGAASQPGQCALPVRVPGGQPDAQGVDAGVCDTVAERVDDGENRGTDLIDAAIPGFWLSGTLTGLLDGARAAGQDAVELAARGDVELGEDFAQVVLDGVCADE